MPVYEKEMSKEELLKLLDEYRDKNVRLEIERDTYKNALKIFAKAEPVGNPDKLTLTELAHELRRLFRFKYLTVSSTNGWCINVWKYFKPEWNESDGEWIGSYLAFDIYPDELICELDFSEYVDADGDVDFSKCIVEVE